jgi:hypothetical protein
VPKIVEADLVKLGTLEKTAKERFLRLEGLMMSPTSFAKTRPSGR